MQLTKHLVRLMLVVFVSTFSLSSHANLIINGSFEDNDVAYGQWQWFVADDVNGWNGSNIEIWDHLQGEAAYHGQQFAELNAHPRPQSAFSIYQDFATTAGQTYSLSFAYQARRNKIDETFSVAVSDVAGQLNSSIMSWVLNDHTTNGWKFFSATFTAQSTMTQLVFTTVRPSTYTYGNFIDDVRVSVPEPTPLMLFGLGMLGLGLSRRLNKSK